MDAICDPFRHLHRKTTATSFVIRRSRSSEEKIPCEPDFGLTSPRRVADIPVNSGGASRNVDCNGRANPVNIRFISSLDPEDEIRFATAMLAGLSKLLDELPIAYTIRLETAAGQVIEHHHAASVQTLAAGELWKSPPAAEKSTAFGSKVSPSPQKTDVPE